MSGTGEVDEDHLELVEMRLDIDVEALCSYLVANSDFPDGPVEIKQFNKGQSNPTYLLTASDGHRYVIRKQPPGHLLAGAHNVGREYTVLDALKDTDVPVPRTLLFCDDHAVIGTDFYVMDFVNGRIMEDTTLADQTPEDRAAIYDSLADTLAALHRIDVNAVGLERFGRPTGYVQRQMKTWGGQYEAADKIVRDADAWKAAGLPYRDDGDVMPRLRAYLDANVEAELAAEGDEPVCIVHDPTEPKVITLLDWELCTIGNPAADLAYFCNNSFGPDGLKEQSPGIPSESAYLANYFAKVGRPQITPRFWAFLKAFILFRSAAINHGVFSRGLGGNASSTRALEMGKGETSNWAEMCENGLKLIDAANSNAKL